MNEIGLKFHSSAALVAATLLCGGLTTAQAVVSRAGTTIDNGTVSVTQSPNAGGAVVSLKYGGTEFIDVNDLGRLMQCSSYANSGWNAFTTDGYTFSPSNRIVINPNQAGDALNKASTTFFVSKLNSTTLQSKSTPREWFTHNWPGLDAQGGAKFDTGRFVNTITIIPGYSNRVVKVDYKFNPPVKGAWRTEVPALYLLAANNTFYGVDAVNNSLSSLTTSGIAATAYRPASGIGGILATTSANGKTIGIYGAFESKGGDVGARFVCYNFGAAVATKLGTETSIRTLSAGQVETYTTYVVTGSSPTDVKNCMISMYNAGLR